MNESQQKSNLEHVVRIVAVGLGISWFELAGELWKFGRKLMRGLASEGLYEVMEYETWLEIHDDKGERATVKKRQKVKYLQNHIIAYQDQAWGDGNILVDYRCSPGVPVDNYRYGQETIQLISLREEKSKGAIDEFNIEWDWENGLLTNTEAWATQISHRTGKVRVEITFPQSRPPIQVQLIETNRRRTQVLGKDNLKKLSDGRWLVIWEKEKPTLYENYVLKWEW